MVGEVRSLPVAASVSQIWELRGSCSALPQDLFHAVGWIPRALLFADVEDLAGVVGIVSPDVSDGRRPRIDLGVIGGLDGFFPCGHDVVEVLHNRGPIFCVECFECLVVIATEFFDWFAIEFGEVLAIPEYEVGSELPDRVVFFAVAPAGLLGVEALDRNVGRNKPVFLIVSGFQLFEKDAAERGGWFLLSLGRQS